MDAETREIDPKFLAESLDAGRNKLNCLQCRVGKKKCDRVQPVCERCQKLGTECTYPDGRLRPGQGAKRKNVRELEARVAQLEDLVTQQSRKSATQAPKAGDESSHDAKPSTAVSKKPVVTNASLESLGSSLLDGLVIDFQQSPPTVLDTLVKISEDDVNHNLPFSIIEELTDAYFAKCHHGAPMLHPARYVASLRMPPHQRPILCLQYIIMAQAAATVPTYKHLAMALYQRARHCAELDEMKGQGEYFTSLAHAQTWTLMSHFEAQHLMFSRASMSLTRSIRVAQMLQLHRLDVSEPNAMPVLPPAADWTEKEMRRRVFWVLFCSDRLTSSTTEWPSMINYRDIQTFLPASEEAFQSETEEPTSSLNDALSMGTSIWYSPFAGKVLAAHLFSQTLDHSREFLPTKRPDDFEIATYWRRHRDIDNNLSTMLMHLPDSLRVARTGDVMAPPPRGSNYTAAVVNLTVHTAILCLHHAAMARVRGWHLDMQLALQSKARLLPAAEEILDIVRNMTDVEASFRNPQTAFTTYMAASVFVNDFVFTHNRQSEMNLEFLLDVLVLVSRRNNVVATSLAVQLAVDLKQHGIGSATDKVKNLAPAPAVTMPLFTQYHSTMCHVVFRPNAAYTPTAGAGAGAVPPRPLMGMGPFPGLAGIRNPLTMRVPSTSAGEASSGFEFGLCVGQQ